MHLLYAPRVFILLNGECGLEREARIRMPDRIDCSGGSRILKKEVPGKLAIHICMWLVCIWHSILQ